MHHNAWRCGYALGVLGMAAVASAGIVVEYRATLGGSGSFTNVLPPNSVSISGNDVTITPPGDSAWKVRTDSPSAESIGTITFVTNSTSPTVALLIAPSTDNEIHSDRFSSNAALNWGGLEPGDAVVTVQARIGGALVGDVVAEVVNRVDIAGEIDANITHQSAASSLLAVTGASFVRGRTISSAGGAILLVQTVGDLDGNVVNATGSIGQIISDAGMIGSSTATPFLEITAGLDLARVEAYGFDDGVAVGGIRANISVGRILSVLRSSGDAEGTLTAYQMTNLQGPGGSISGVSVRRNFAMDTEIVQGISRNTRYFDVGSLGTEETGPIPFQIGTGMTSNGLGTQIKVNAFPKEYEGSWISPVEITYGGVTHSIGGAGNSDYEVSSYDLGAFSENRVGLVPYTLYGVNCVPGDGEVVSYAQAPAISKPVTIDHYGQVRWVDYLNQTPTVIDPYVIEARPIGGTTWTDVTSCFVSTLSNPPYDYQVQSEPVAHLPNGVEFRFTHPEIGLAGGLVSVAGDDDAGPAVGDYVYGFTVGTFCPGDINGDSLVNGSDLSILLANFSTDPGCFVAGDMNLNFEVEGGDLSILLSNWNASCGAASRGNLVVESFTSSRSTVNAPASNAGHDEDMIHRESSIGPSGSSADGLTIINAFGYASFEAYGAWVNMMTPAEFANHAEVLQAVIQELATPGAGGE